jgi:hypothetical protein
MRRGAFPTAIGLLTFANICFAFVVGVLSRGGDFAGTLFFYNIITGVAIGVFYAGIFRRLPIVAAEN